MDLHREKSISWLLNSIPHCSMSLCRDQRYNELTFVWFYVQSSHLQFFTIFLECFSPVVVVAAVEIFTICIYTFIK